MNAATRLLDRTRAQRKSVTRILAKTRAIAKDLREATDGLASINLAGAINALAESEGYLIGAETRLQDAQTGRPAA